MFIFRVNVLTFTSGGGGGGGGVTGQKAAKPVTSVQGCVSGFVGGKPLDIFDGCRFNIGNPDRRPMDRFQTGWWRQ